MNPVFWLLVALVAVLLWFLLTFVFIPLGKIINKKWNNTMKILNEEVGAKSCGVQIPTSTNERKI